MSKTAVSAIAITASTPACTGSVIIKSACSVTLPGIFKEITITPFSFFIFLTASDISPPIKEPANTKTCALGSLGGYIVETQFPYRNLIVINKTSEPIKIEIPVFDESWIEEHRELGLEVIPVSKEDNYLKMWKRAHAELDKIRN